ncbi:3-deoxy-manno-octulosonate cytidylyltransferase [Bacteriovorax sp. Seq25_V]|uniref:3-deoxy-manno-octulosonate cytidylyltransferase n=1 Tax=Bacteriovorax sp. Seq25_V TaxID=1201288 RepID=UPI00038A08F0|nr:3-deoxy-manno-octulosonate cytidylyltransferase [Bacteriovorax sp. Seq25_V]EQC46694.1 3-deoxy-D-manno-octulosonate cytidylyltransferase [Bacteriovorax sp. Seq25_V]
MKALVLIPSRYASTRFPGKPLAKISGLSMVERVYRGCEKILDFYPDSVVAVVTDNNEIENEVKSFGGTAVRVDDDVPSGSERINLAYQRHFKNRGFDFVINVQGDEPLIEADLLKKLIEFHSTSNRDATTVVKKISQADENFKDPNKVKAIFNEDNGICHYFSRAQVPFNRNQADGVNWFLHIGIYSFRPNVLEEFCKLPQSKNEQIECLEQLRLLDNGFTMGAVQTEMTLCGVDSPEDIKVVERIINEKK